MPGKRRLAIIGAGSSGLVTLKFAIDQLQGWEVVCFEKTQDTTGVWGNPYRGFVSTSTKYTTQFACHRKFDSSADPEGEGGARDFFRDGEYGEYLDGFVRENELDRHIEKETPARRIEKVDGGWKLHFDEGREELFDKLIVCTGLAEKPKNIETEVEVLRTLSEDRPVRGKKIVVIGGGESAVDYANRLAAPELHNEVYLSLRTGVRVSPRYHPIRGVPSDFLRNRYLLSIHENIRNAVGQKFVEARIKHQEKFERVFRSKTQREGESPTAIEKKKYWSSKLTEKAKDNLFNMFHNKSDDFLDAVADDRISIIGSNQDEGYRIYSDFDGEETLQIDPDYLVPMIGYESNLGRLFGGEVGVKDFYLGCVHVDYDDLFLIGFARPIIGNIPSISEMQARWVIGQIGGRFPRPSDIAERQKRELAVLAERYPELNRDAMVPVEMIPYCDRLAKLMGSYPSLWKVKSPWRWLKIRLTPASTLHYLNEDYDPKFVRRQKVHSPLLITILLSFIKIFDIPYSWIKGRRPS